MLKQQGRAKLFVGYVQISSDNKVATVVGSAEVVDSVHVVLMNVSARV